MTRASKSRDEVAAELGYLQSREDEKSSLKHQEIPPSDIPHRQAFVRRECRLVDGKWAIVDEIDGAMSIVVEFENGAYYFLLKEDHREVYVATSPQEAMAMADHVTQGQKIR